MHSRAFAGLVYEGINRVVSAAVNCKHRVEIEK